MHLYLQIEYLIHRVNRVRVNVCHNNIFEYLSVLSVDMTEYSSLGSLSGQLDGNPIQ